jgi:hypothetical protein
MHFLGLAGMPRRIPDYPVLYTKYNFIATIGSTISLASMVYFIVLVGITIFFSNINKFSVVEFFKVNVGSYYYYLFIKIKIYFKFYLLFCVVVLNQIVFNILGSIKFFIVFFTGGFLKISELKNINISSAIKTI